MARVIKVEKREGKRWLFFLLILTLLHGGELEGVLEDELNSPSTSSTTSFPSSGLPSTQPELYPTPTPPSIGVEGSVEESIIITGWGEFNPLGGFADGKYILVNVEFKSAPKKGWTKAILTFARQKGAFQYQQEEVLWLKKLTQGIAVYYPEMNRTYFVSYSSPTLKIEVPRTKLILTFHY